MEKSTIDASIKEAVIAEVKKLTGYAPKSSNKLHQFEGNFSVKYVHDHYLHIANADIGVMFTPKAEPADLIWQKAAEMLKIAVEVPEPRRAKVFNHLLVLAQEYLGWKYSDKLVRDDGDLGFPNFWKIIKDTYGCGVPSYKSAANLNLQIEKGCSRREYLDLIVDEILAQSASLKKEAPEYIPPTPPVNPIEQALAEIAELRTRVEVIEHVKDVEIKALRKHHAETELDSKTLANLAYNRVSAFIGQGITPSQQDFEHWWTEFRKENGYATEQPTKPEYAPTPDQIYALWLMVKDGDKSFPDALPYKTFSRFRHPLVKNLVQVEVQGNFEFTISPTTFYPLANSKGERPTFAQCRQAIAGTIFTNLQTLFNDQAK